MTEGFQLVDRLQRFGFSEKEARVYLAVVERGRAKLSTVASDAGVSKSYVYQICDQLDQRDLVTVDDHQSPAIVRAHPPSSAFERRVREIEDTVSEIERRYEQPADDMESLEVVRSRPTLNKRLRDLIETAESEILLQLPVQFLPEVSGVLRDAVDRGVLVLLAVSGGTDEVLTGAYEDIATAVRTWNKGTTVYLSADRERGIISPSSVLEWEHGNAEAICFDNDAIAVAVEGAFSGTVWPAAQEILLRQPTLPREYGAGEIRHAAYDSTLSLQAGRSVHARIEARPIGEEQEPHTISGRVVEARQMVVEPLTGNFALENALSLETDDGRISVGGKGAFVEDYVASSISLRTDKA